MTFIQCFINCKMIINGIHKTYFVSLKRYVFAIKIKMLSKNMESTPTNYNPMYTFQFFNILNTQKVQIFCLKKSGEEGFTKQI